MKPPGGSPGQIVFRDRVAFSLLELLVVIAVLVLLIALLLPMLRQARQQGRLAVCLSQHRQTLVATNAYAADYRDFIPMSPTKAGIGLHYLKRGGKWDGIPDVEAPPEGFFGQGLLWHLSYLSDRGVLLDPGYQPARQYSAALNEHKALRRHFGSGPHANGAPDWDLLTQDHTVVGTYVYYGYQWSDVQPTSQYRHRRVYDRAAPRFQESNAVMTALMMCRYGGTANPAVAGHSDYDTCNIGYTDGHAITADGVRKIRPLMPGNGNANDCAWWSGQPRSAHNWWEWATWQDIDSAL